MPEVKDKEFDVIVIGSGLGGLTTASLLAKLENKKVLLLERHFNFGGFTDTFKREGKFEWDVGIHYIGQMNVGNTSRALFDYVTEGKVDWFKMPATYDKYVFPDFTFDVRIGIDNFRNDLIAQFPHEENAINQYFEDIKKIQAWTARYSITHILPKFLSTLNSIIRKIGSKLAYLTSGEYFNERFTDEKLKAVLVGQWGLYGLPPQYSSFIPHASVTAHYAGGGYYPVGGSRVIVDSILEILERHGGVMKLNHSVEEIIVKNGKAIGVKVIQKKGKQKIEKEFFADTIISNAGALTTYMKMIPENVDIPFMDEVLNYPDGTANVTLYLGLKDNPDSLGVAGENFWIYDNYDHDEMYSRRNEIAKGKVPAAFVSFPSMKDPHSKGHTAEIIAFMDTEPFAEWKDKYWRQRGKGYEEFKSLITKALVDFVEPAIPGLTDLIEYHELSTPLTTEDFTNHPRGNIYGVPSYPDRFKVKWISPRTPIKKFYLTGADAASFGIIGALLSGILSTVVAIGKPWKIFRIFSDAIKYSKKLHSIE
jgi:all-trans-retinol 13,14-reductase